MPRPGRNPLLALAAAAMLGGCGYDPEPIAVENRTIGLRLDEYRIMPQAVSAPAGPLRLIIRNLGELPHNIAVETIRELNSEEPIVRIALTPPVHSGRRSEVSFLGEPGTYRLVCTIQNHDDLGQVGTLIVE